MKPSRDIDRLVEIMAALRNPQGGCPWDLEQDFSTIAPYTIEEAYEVAEAIERGDMDDLRDELGDLLLQVVYHAQLAWEDSAFTLGDVILSITSKMIRRHPHVFDDDEARAAGAAKGMWNRIKAEEKRERRERKGLEESDEESLLNSVGRGRPPLAMAVELQSKAATVGFDWNDPRQVVAKLREEIAELEAELDYPEPDGKRLEEEFGDLMFAAANLARHLGIDPNSALTHANLKFRRRFNAIEIGLAESGRTMKDASLTEMEALWQDAKRAEEPG